MKHSSKKQTADLLEQRLYQLKDKIFNYEPNGLSELGEISETIVRSYEYWISSSKKPVLRCEHQQNINAWFRTIFSNQTCLVLLFEGKHYSYTRKYILKKIRGIHLHSDQDDGVDKSKALRSFIFEEDGVAHFEFAITHCWINTGGFTYDSGNTDSKNPFRERLKIDDREIIVTTLESLVFNIALEFWKISQEGSYVNDGRLLMDVTLEELQGRFGDRIGKDCFDVVLWHKENRPKA